MERVRDTEGYGWRLERVGRGNWVGDRSIQELLTRKEKEGRGRK